MSESTPDPEATESPSHPSLEQRVAKLEEVVGVLGAEWIRLSGEAGGTQALAYTLLAILDLQTDLPSVASRLEHRFAEMRAQKDSPARKAGREDVAAIILAALEQRANATSAKGH
jgi:hypothetical protein